MDFSKCRSQFNEYVAKTLKVGVYPQGPGGVVAETVSVDGDLEVRVVVSNHPDGERDAVGQENPPNGANFNDVRLHLIVSDKSKALLLVPENAELAYFRSGWEVTNEVLTPGELVAELFIHFDPTHPTFELSTDDVLDDFIVTARAQNPGSFTVLAEARVTPRWRTVGIATTSATLTVE